MQFGLMQCDAIQWQYNNKRNNEISFYFILCHVMWHRLKVYIHLSITILQLRFRSSIRQSIVLIEFKVNESFFSTVTCTLLNHQNLTGTSPVPQILKPTLWLMSFHKKAEYIRLMCVDMSIHCAVLVSLKWRDKNEKGCNERRVWTGDSIHISVKHKWTFRRSLQRGSLNCLSGNLKKETHSFLD